mmetsp:Transcript_57451/g.136618  ORF Transcript_57451/g.136618 Transcript_57451/m.136618 type:complete len:253 (-) Transcript_57451:424-1182(-)
MRFLTVGVQPVPLSLKWPRRSLKWPGFGGQKDPLALEDQIRRQPCGRRLDIHGALLDGLRRLGVGDNRLGRGLHLGPHLRPAPNRDRLVGGLDGAGALAQAGRELDRHQPLLLAHLEDFGVEAAKEALILAHPRRVCPHLVRRVLGLEGHDESQLAVALDAPLPLLLDGHQLREPLALHDEAEAVEGGVEVGVVAVAVPCHVLLDLLEDVVGLLLPDGVTLGVRDHRHRKDLRILQRDPAESDGDAVNEAEC